MLLLWTILTARAETWTVGPVGDFETLSGALRVADDGDTLVLEAGTYTGCLNLYVDLNIEGAGVDATVIEGDGSCSTLLSMEERDVHLTDLSMTNPAGNAISANQSALTLTRVRIHGCGVEASGLVSGAAVTMEGGNLKVEDSSFEDNHAYLGGAIRALEGGAITLSQSTFVENEAQNGGALAVSGLGTRLEMSGVTIHDNRASGEGGGLHVADGATLWSEGSIWSGNHSNGPFGGGGAISADRAQLRILLDSFTGNEGSRGGGALRVVSSNLSCRLCALEENSSYGAGGAIYTQQSTVWLTRSDLLGNSSDLAGGALFGDDSALVLRRARVEDNLAQDHGGAVRAAQGSLAIHRSSFSHNRAGMAGGAVAADGMSSLTISTAWFCRNEAGSGGAVSLEEQDGASFEDITWMENAAILGGSLSARGVTGLSIWDNTLVAGAAERLGGGIFLSESSLELGNTALVWTPSGAALATMEDETNSAAVLSYNDWYDNLDDHLGGTFASSGLGEQDLTLNPLFVDYTPDGNCLNDDLSLALGSPLLDAGDPDRLDEDGSRSDIGANASTMPLWGRDAEDTGASEDTGGAETGGGGKAGGCGCGAGSPVSAGPLLGAILATFVRSRRSRRALRT